VHRQDGGLIEHAHEVGEPLAAFTAEEPVFVLDVDEVRGIDADQLGRRCVTVAALLPNPSDYLGVVPPHVCAGFVNSNNRAREPKGPVVRVDHVFGEGRDAAFTRRVRTQE
jgi:hypothetical protein